MDAICGGAEFGALGEEDRRDGDVLEGDNPEELEELVRQYGILLPCRAVTSDTLSTEISSCERLRGHLNLERDSFCWKCRSPDEANVLCLSPLELGPMAGSRPCRPFAFGLAPCKR